MVPVVALTGDLLFVVPLPGSLPQPHAVGVVAALELDRVGDMAGAGSVLARCAGLLPRTGCREGPDRHEDDEPEEECGQDR